MAYSGYFGSNSVSGISMPKIEDRSIFSASSGRTNQQRVTLGGSGGSAGWAGNQKADPMLSRLDQAMSGIDGKADEYEQVLRGVYDNYSASADKYSGDIEALADAMDGDIAKLTGYIGDYENVLAEIKPDFMNGIKVEESADQRRAEYMGNVAQQYANSEKSQNREMAAQGINPYANSGNRRANLLSRNAAMAGAGNQAYSDWLDSHNQQVQADQGAKATYAELAAKPASMQGDVVSARGSLAGLYDNLANRELDAQKAKAAGYEYLNNANMEKRAQELQLADNYANRQLETQKLNQAADASNANLQMEIIKSGLSSFDPYSPLYNR